VTRPHRAQRRGGKTTLFNAVCGLEGIQAGRITFDGTRSHPTPARPTSPGWTWTPRAPPTGTWPAPPWATTSPRRAPTGPPDADRALRLGQPARRLLRHLVLAGPELERQRQRPGRRHPRALAHHHQAHRLHPLGRHRRHGRRPPRGAESVAGGTDFQMFEILLILAVVTIGGAAVCSGALAGGLALGFLPGNAQDVFHRGGHRRAALPPDGVPPLFYVPAPALVERGGGPTRTGAPDPGDGRDCRTPRQPLSLNPCHVRLRPARERHARGVTFSVSRGSACPQSPSSSARDGRPR
jgi:hypothetical protein